MADDNELLERRIYVVDEAGNRLGYVTPCQEPTLDGTRYRKRLEWLGYTLGGRCVCHFKLRRDAVAYLAEHGAT
jgi:hypothetical protein